MITMPQAVPVDRIFLDLSNPRHVAYASEAEVIEYLCRHEHVYTLAKDITQVRLNPLEIFAVIPTDAKKRTRPTYFVAEGNRRLCAIKLLNDPDLAPAKLRRDFMKLAESTQPIDEVLALVFEEKEQVHAWLEKIHGGVQGGVGRKPWNAEQKTRHLGDRKNLLAQSILDYAQQRGFISPEERKGKLTTAQRYLGNAFLKEAIGIESTNSADVSRNRPQEDFDAILRAFTRDLVDGTVHSRSNSDNIRQYARNLSSIDGLINKRVPSVAISYVSGSRFSKRKPKEPLRPKNVSYERSIEDALKQLGSYKLQKLYYSLCDIPLDKHTPLVSIGAWSFFETLTARCGRESTVNFPSFLSQNRLVSMGFGEREHRNAISQALARLSAYGNTTKHHDTSANFNGEQLVNDMETLTALIAQLIGEAKQKNV